MTSQGSFKRAVRQRARATGQRYTEARAVMEQAGTSPFAGTRPFDVAGPPHTETPWIYHTRCRLLPAMALLLGSFR